MSFSHEYTHDTEFRKLIARRKDVNLLRAALEITRDLDSSVDFEAVELWVEHQAGELTPELARAADERAALIALAEHFVQRCGITGRRDSYETDTGSFLHVVIERKTGIPIALSVLYMAVAEAAGLRLRGVAAPGHFITRYDSADGPLFIDPFRDGQISTLEETLDRVQTENQLNIEAGLAALKAVGPRPIIIRMLNNLKSLYAKQQEWRRCLLVQQRLLSLQPSSYGEQRDLGLISLKAGRAGQALDLLEACIKACPKDETPVLQQQLAEARREIARWN
jgi:regulator of sirC expression with transglutaminase-like and TPR domain